MPIPALAVAAGSAAVKYAPAVYDAAKSALSKATGNKVTDPANIATYVGNNASRMTVVADALIRSGVAVDDIFPHDLVQSNPNLRLMRDSALRLATTLKAQFDAGSDKIVKPQSSDEMAADVVRVKRVRAVLDVYGSAEKYFLCHPNGGVPATDFAYVQAMSKALSMR
jgi:hypothetical protein